MLKVGSVTKYFKDQKIFSNLDLTVAKGRFHVIVGPSGCGKSTLFDGLTGVIPLDGGSISWNHESLSNLMYHAAYMQQKDLLLPWFSLLDNALLPAVTSGQDMKDAKNQAQSLFERLGLKGYESHYASQVSGGMRQRCALVRTLMFNRDLILLDEPLSAVDTITRRSLQSLLLLLQTEFKKTILMITHDIEEALLLADEIYLFSPMPMSMSRHFILDSPKPRKFNDPTLLAIKADVLDKLEGDLINEQG
ncbi:MAG: ABC transporter ATP-binding protein [Proteobacteria bacterium]|nr:ABC transporter ATP-binding protein [Pseudomonadota bacterium]MBU1696491.1 ABC transporter ATP-binding protein [Pseudomonadota bacterium]